MGIDLSSRKIATQMDFVHDQLATGPKIRILTIVDTFSGYAPATDARFSYRGEDVVRTLESVFRKVGYPKSIRVDNGSEFVSKDLDLWAYKKMSRLTSHVVDAEHRFAMTQTNR